MRTPDTKHQTVVLVKTLPGRGHLQPGARFTTQHPDTLSRPDAIAAAYEALRDQFADEHADDWEQLTVAAGRETKEMVFSRWPLVLPHAQIRRMLDGHRLLILSRDLDADAYEVHDEHTIRRNLRNRRRGLAELQDDPAVFAVELGDVQRRPLLDLDLVTVRHAGFDTLEDFYLDWLDRRKEIVVGLEVKLYRFEIMSDALYLHRKPHRGYTRNPAHAVPDEPEVIDRASLERYATDARDRYARDHAEEIARREARSLASQLRAARAAAAARGVDVTPEIQAIRRQLDQINSKLGNAA